MTSRPQRSNPGSVGHQNALTVAAIGRSRSTKVASRVAKVANRAAKVASRVAPIVTSSAAAPLSRSVEAVADDALADAREPEAAEAAAAEVVAKAETPAARGRRRHLLLPVVARCAVAAVARKAVGKEAPGQAATSEVPSAYVVGGDPAASAEVPGLLGAEPDGEDVLEEGLGVAVRERGPGVGRGGLSLLRAPDRRGRRRRRRGRAGDEAKSD